MNPAAPPDDAALAHSPGDAPVQYSRTAILLHWLIGLWLMAQVGWGLYLDEVPRGTAARSVAVNWHKSLGLIVAALIVFRLYWRLTHRPPAPPPSVSGWQTRLAGATHLGLYLCMIGLPVAGYLASNFSKFGIRFLNLWHWKPWGSEDAALYAWFNGLHVALAWLFIALVALHVAGALSHLRSRHDGVLARMLRLPR
jgi:cytochrome b561